MKNINAREKELETMAVLAAAALVFFVVFRKNGFVYTALGLLLLPLFFKRVAAKVSALWLRFAELLSAFNTRLILGLIYFLMLTPLAFLFRIFTRKHVNSPKSVYGDTYFTVREHKFGASDFETMW